MEQQEVMLRVERMVEVDLTPAMLEIERHKDLDLSLIGASDVPALLGLSPWAGPADVQRRILEGERFQPSAAAFWGSTLEASIIDAYAKGQGMTYTKPGSRTHPKGRPWQRVSLDALSADGCLIVEAKCVSDYRWETEFGGGTTIPPSVRAQVQTQLEAYDADEAVVLVSRWDEPGRLWKEVVEPEANTQQHILETCEAFWRRHIIDREPVEEKPLAAAPTREDLIVHDFAEEALLLERLAKVLAEKKTTEAAEAELKAALRARLETSGAQRIKSNFGSVSRVKPSVKEQVRWQDVALMARGRFTDEEWRSIVQASTEVRETSGRVMVRTKGQKPDGE